MFDIIIMDLHMPAVDGIADGFAASKRIRQLE